MFKKTTSASHCFCLKPTAQCTLTERIHCSIACLNVYIVLKNFFRKALLVLEAQHSLFFQRVHILSTCMFEYVKCFEKILLETIPSAWSQTLSVLPQSAYFVQLYVCMCIMFQKNSSATHCFCLKSTTQSTFTERIPCSIVCLNMYTVLKNFSWNPLLLLEGHHSLYFRGAHNLFNCMFECVYCFEKFFWNSLLLLEGHHSLYFRGAQTSFNCMFESL